MKCDVCGTPHAPHEIVQGRCHRCTHRVLTDCLKALLRFHDESPETGAVLPRDCWLPEYRAAVETAEREVNKGVDIHQPPS